jgi:hypothetical protein
MIRLDDSTERQMARALRERERRRGPDAHPTPIRANSPRAGEVGYEPGLAPDTLPAGGVFGFVVGFAAGTVLTALVMAMLLWQQGVTLWR